MPPAQLSAQTVPAWLKLHAPLLSQPIPHPFSVRVQPGSPALQAAPHHLLPRQTPEAQSPPPLQGEPEPERPTQLPATHLGVGAAHMVVAVVQVPLALQVLTTFESLLQLGAAPQAE